MNRVIASGIRCAATAFAAFASAPATYLGVLSIAGSRRCEYGTADGIRFAIVIPAHNEQDALPSTLASVQAINYDHRNIDIIVVADNCDDETADVARFAGVTVIERVDPQHRGKGYALERAFNDASTQHVDVVVVIDADTIVDPALLSHLAWCFHRGSDAVQVDYRVRNPDAGWRTALMDVSFTAKHLVRSRGRQRFGLSVGLRGNGMAFSRALLDSIPYDAYSAVEDVEFGLAIADSGRKVDGCDATWVAGDMPTTAEDSVSQRVRWEGGHRQLAERHGWSMLREGSTALDPRRVDAAVDVLTPPLARMTIHLLLATLLSRLPLRKSGMAATWFVVIGWLSLVAHLATAIASCRSPRRALAACINVPSYVWWKLTLGRPEGPREWVRTNRSPHINATPEAT